MPDPSAIIFFFFFCIPLNRNHCWSTPHFADRMATGQETKCFIHSPDQPIFKTETWGSEERTPPPRNTSKKSWVFFRRYLSSVSSRKLFFKACWLWLASWSSPSSFSRVLCGGKKKISRVKSAVTLILHTDPDPENQRAERPSPSNYSWSWALQSAVNSTFLWKAAKAWQTLSGVSSSDSGNPQSLKDEGELLRNSWCLVPFR